MTESIEEIRTRIEERKSKINDYFKKHLSHLEPDFQELKKMFPEITQLAEEYRNNKEYYEYEIRNNLDKYTKDSDISKIADLFWALGFPKKLHRGFRKFETVFNRVKGFGLDSLFYCLSSSHVWECGSCKDEEVLKLEIHNYVDFLRIVKEKYNIPDKGISIFAGRDFVPGVVFEGCVLEDIREDVLSIGSEIAASLGYKPPQNKLVTPVEYLEIFTGDEYDFLFTKGGDFVMSQDYKKYCGIIDSLIRPGGFLLDCDGVGKKLNYTKLGEEKHESRLDEGIQHNLFYLPHSIEVYQKPAK